MGTHRKKKLLKAWTVSSQTTAATLVSTPNYSQFSILDFSTSAMLFFSTLIMLFTLFAPSSHLENCLRRSVERGTPLLISTPPILNPWTGGSLSGLPPSVTLCHKNVKINRKNFNWNRYLLRILEFSLGFFSLFW